LTAGESPESEVLLPHPRPLTGQGIEDVMLRRRSVREYLMKPLSLEEAALLCWSAQGISEVGEGLRTSPSAGARYPITLYLVVGEGGVEGLREGIYRYIVERHSLYLHKEGDFRKELSDAALDQEHVARAPLTLTFAVDFRKTTSRYGDRGYRYVWIDVGHAAQNVYLAATALGLGTVGVGAFKDEKVTEILSLNRGVHPAYLMPVGHPSTLAPRSSKWEDIREYIERQRGVSIS